MIWTQKILHKIIMKQSWLTFALTENKSEIISANFFLFFFNIATILSFAFDKWIIW